MWDVLQGKDAAQSAGTLEQGSEPSDAGLNLPLAVYRVSFTVILLYREESTSHTCFHLFGSLRDIKRFSLQPLMQKKLCDQSAGLVEWVIPVTRPPRSFCYFIPLDRQLTPRAIKRCRIV